MWKAMLQEKGTTWRPPSEINFVLEELPEELRDVVIDLSTDPVQPLYPSTWDNPPEQDLNHTYLKSECMDHLDQDIVFQAITGIQDESTAPKVTMLAFHHKGLQQQATLAAEDMANDLKEGWVTEPQGLFQLPCYPIHLVPQNMVDQGTKWRNHVNNQ